MSKDRPGGMDSTSMSMNKPQTDHTKMSKVASVAGGKVDKGGDLSAPKLPAAGD